MQCKKELNEESGELLSAISFLPCLFVFCSVLFFIFSLSLLSMSILFSFFFLFQFLILLRSHVCFCSALSATEILPRSFVILFHSKTYSSASTSTLITGKGNHCLFLNQVA